MKFNLELYQNAWRKIDRSKILTLETNLVEPISLAVFERISSTNTKLWQLIDRPIELPMGAIALQQTAGKGQWGHSWVSSPGGLYLSVGMDLDLEIANYPHLVMATAWGVAKVLRYFQLPVTIKWSNDLILARRKLGGIKIETRNNHNKLIKAVVGVGINWRNTVPEPGISLDTYCRAKNRLTINSLEELTAITAYGIWLGYQYYLTVGIEILLNEYLKILHSLGQQLYLNGSRGEVVGVNSEGKLRVKLRSPGASTEIMLSPGQISLGYGYSQ